MTLDAMTTGKTCLLRSLRALQQYMSTETHLLVIFCRLPGAVDESLSHLASHLSEHGNVLTYTNIDGNKELYCFLIFINASDSPPEVLGRFDTNTITSGLVTALPEAIATSPFTIQTRLYRSLAPAPVDGVTPSWKSVPHFLVINCMTPSEASNDDFTRWYTEEHIPILSRVPGWISSLRYELVGFDTISTAASSRNETVTSGLGNESKLGLSEPPKYAALHQWSSLDAFATEEFKQATNTPWRTRVIAEVKERERFVMKWNLKM